MDMEKKRQRAPNYSSKEKEVLLVIVNKFKNIVENKKTDAVSVQDKKLAWFQITQEFNSVSPNNCFRDTDSLKKFYDNLKEDIRKRAGEQRRALYKTGGGPPSPKKKDDCDDLILGIVNKKTIFGLPNLFDNDEVEVGQEQPLRNKEPWIEPGGTENQDSLFEVSNVSKISHQTAPETVTSDQIEIVFSEDHPTETSVPIEPNDSVKDKFLWTQSKPSDLGKPLAPCLQKNIKKTYGSTASTPSAKKKLSRHRPTVIKPLSSSTLAEKNEILLDKKISLADGLQKEHELRMTLLRLDVALKKTS